MYAALIGVLQRRIIEPTNLTTTGMLANLALHDPASYSSGQIWLNTTGDAQYNFYLGADGTAGADDPTYGGSPAAFTFNGSQYLTGAAASTFIKNMHKSGSKFTIEAWFYYSGASNSNVHPIFDTGTSDQSGPDTSRGVIFTDLGTLNSGGNSNSLRVKRDSSAANALNVEGDTTLTVGWHMVAASIDGTGAAQSFLYTDGAYDPVLGNNTWDGTFSSPGTLDPVNMPRIGARGDANFRLPNGNKVAVVRLYNTNLSKAELDANWSATRFFYNV